MQEVTDEEKGGLPPMAFFTILALAAAAMLLYRGQ
jgi:hypothetical protein